MFYNIDSMPIIYITIGLQTEVVRELVKLTFDIAALKKK